MKIRIDYKLGYLAIEDGDDRDNLIYVEGKPELKEHAEYIRTILVRQYQNKYNIPYKDIIIEGVDENIQHEPKVIAFRKGNRKKYGEKLDYFGNKIVEKEGKQIACLIRYAGEYYGGNYTELLNEDYGNEKRMIFQFNTRNYGTNQGTKVE